MEKNINIDISNGLSKHTRTMSPRIKYQMNSKLFHD